MSKFIDRMNQDWMTALLGAAAVVFFWMSGKNYVWSRCREDKRAGIFMQNFVVPWVLMTMFLVIYYVYLSREGARPGTSSPSQELHSSIRGEINDAWVLEQGSRSENPCVVKLVVSLLNGGKATTITKYQLRIEPEGKPAYLCKKPLALPIYDMNHSRMRAALSHGLMLVHPALGRSEQGVEAKPLYDLTFYARLEESSGVQGYLEFAIDPILVDTIEKPGTKLTLIFEDAAQNSYEAGQGNSIYPGILVQRDSDSVKMLSQELKTKSYPNEKLVGDVTSISFRTGKKNSHGITEFSRINISLRVQNLGERETTLVGCLLIPGGKTRKDACSLDLEPYEIVIGPRRKVDIEATLVAEDIEQFRNIEATLILRDITGREYLMPQIKLINASFGTPISSLHVESN